MSEGMVQFEVEILSYSRIRSRILWPDSHSPWMEGCLEELVVHCTYAAWTAYLQGMPLVQLLKSPDDSVGHAISDILTRTMESMGAALIGEIRMNGEAFDELRRSHIEP
ncbi:MAG: hypothetical protein JW986_08155 [Methanotrichaceae archaeon]|nr:hypothetical protein [Methanotrichaceae archaeon]